MLLRLHHILRWTCLILCCVILGIWVRSYAVGDRYQWQEVRDDQSPIRLRRGGFVSGMGGFMIYRESLETIDAYRVERFRDRWNIVGTHPNVTYSRSDSPRYPMRAVGDESLLTSLGFQVRRSGFRNESTAQRGYWITIPYWGVALCMGLYPMGVYVAGVLRRQREDRLALGLCPRCGVPMQADRTHCPGCDLATAAFRELQT